MCSNLSQQNLLLNKLTWRIVIRVKRNIDFVLNKDIQISVTFNFFSEKTLKLSNKLILHIICDPDENKKKHFF